jgi:hypothetical protein
MYKCNQILMGIAIRFLVNKFEALSLKAVQFSLDVIHLQGNVVDPLPSFLDKFCNLTFDFSGLKELQIGSFHGDKRKNKFTEIFLI